MLFSALIAAAAILADGAPAVAATPATTATPPTATAPATPAAKTEKPRMICKSEAVIGTLMPKKTCYSVDQAKDRQQAERENLRDIQAKSH
ncbi:hypothetical protein [Phenylobacterium sp.]|jgi:hypothetical protein|uniref:hypothetical protein n=1 Tax=Phenylobacterium sp. TaxID=1871053 RepID=UPI002F419713